MITVSIHIDAKLAKRWKDRFHSRRWALGAATLALAIPAVALASQVVVPHIFSSGDPIVAAEINENFDALAIGINDNDTRISSLEVVVDGSVTADEIGEVCSDGEVLKYSGGAWGCAPDIDTNTDTNTTYSVSCGSNRFVSSMNSTGTASCAAPTLNCSTTSTVFSGLSASVNCSSGSVMTGGGFFLSDGPNNGFNWNDAWARPSGNGYECGRSIGNGDSTCYVRCCSF